MYKPGNQSSKQDSFLEYCLESMRFEVLVMLDIAVMWRVAKSLVMLLLALLFILFLAFWSVFIS